MVPGPIYILLSYPTIEMGHGKQCVMNKFWNMQQQRSMSPLWFFSLKEGTTVPGTDYGKPGVPTSSGKSYRSKNERTIAIVSSIGCEAHGNSLQFPHLKGVLRNTLIFHGCFGALGDDFLSASRQWPDTKDVMRGISWFSRLKSYNRRALYIPGHTVLVGRKFRLRGKNICNNETSAAWGLPCSCLSYTRDKTRFSLETDPISVGVTGRTAS